ncbi:MAG: 50S ribosomal protein L30 [Eubacteriales bacterium]|nr:50S ribosomal protein L30 [Eubacteriales bacterium]MDD4421959.1 50S ribosomal protein L30 [Eubacteriales bacterium]
MAKVKLTLIKSLIGCKKSQILTAESLGLRKIGDFKVVDKDAPTEGKINVISHLISVEEA